MKYKIKSKQLVAKGQKGLKATPQDSLLLHNTSNELEQAVKNGTITSSAAADTFFAKKLNHRTFSNANYSPVDIVNLPLKNTDNRISIPKFKKPITAVNVSLPQLKIKPRVQNITTLQPKSIATESNIPQPKTAPTFTMPIDKRLVKSEATWLNGNAVASHLGQKQGMYLQNFYDDGSTDMTKTNDNLRSIKKPTELVSQKKQGGQISNISDYKQIINTILAEWKK